MAKEMMIMFVYDMEYCKTEEDDPARAVVYFHPSWVSDQQRASLCGQVMGAAHFLSAVIGDPKLLALQSGKFHLQRQGRFMLAVGTDRNIDDWVLEHRAEVVKSLIRFFHCDLEVVFRASQDERQFSERLYHMFETYLRILHFSGNTFSNSPLLNLPKSASSVFLEAIQILQYCQEMKTVLGGTMLYHNKVLATQLSAELTKTLVMTDPYRIRSAAETVETSYSLPLGVQLLNVYIRAADLRTLSEDGARLRSLGERTRTCVLPRRPSKGKEPVISAMKRDQSLLFTTVPEEEHEHSSHTSPEPRSATPPSEIAKPIEWVRPERPKERPRSLSLRTTTASIVTPIPNNTTVETPFAGRTSICSTPLTDKYLHGNPHSIICNDIELDDFKNQNIKESQTTESINSILSATEVKKYSKDNLKNFNNLKTVSNICVPSSILDRKKSTSVHLHKNNVTMRYFGIGLHQINSQTEEKTQTFNTITDPLFPVFRSDGTVISKPLYDLCLNEHCELFTSEFKDIFDCDNVNSISNTDEWKSVDDFDSDMKESPKKIMPPIKPVLRKTLSLPLKSLSYEGENLIRKNSGVQLTPLMSKLSLLAMEERSSGFCSRDTTPGELGTPAAQFLRRGSTSAPLCRQDTLDDLEDDQDYEKSVLFICGQQDMVLGLLLEQEAAQNEELVRKLWDVCTETLGRLESSLRQCLEPYPVFNGSSSTDPGDSYSYLCVERRWECTRRGGPWGVAELGALTHLHREFARFPNLTEISVRAEDGVIYGYRCGEGEVYYQAGAAPCAGLPPPADALGTTPLKARRKLERDHHIILL